MLSIFKQLQPIECQYEKTMNWIHIHKIDRTIDK